MTSRRAFLGMLAAAPVAVPALAKEAMATSARGIAGIAPYIPLREFKPFEMSAGMFVRDPAAPRGYRHEPISPEDFGHYLSSLSDSECDWSADFPPNRLFGATINADGDAV